MLPQMSPLPWLLVFFLMFFILFSMNMFINSLKSPKFMVKSKMVFCNKSMMPW